MAIVIQHSLDLVQLNDLISQGFTTLALYYSNNQEGPYVTSATTPTPSTLAAALTADEPYEFEFAFSSGHAGMWFKIVASTGASTSALTDAEAFHGGGGTTLRVLRQKLGKLIRAVEIGTTTSIGNVGGTNAFCAEANFRRRRDKYFGGNVPGNDGWNWLNLTTGIWTVVSDYAQNIGEFTFSPAIAQVPSATPFEVWNRWNPDEIRDAINWAIGDSFPLLSKPVVDLSIITEDNVWIYPIPNNIRILNNVEIESHLNETELTNSNKGYPWTDLPYLPYDNMLSRSIEFKHEPPFHTGIGGYRLRLTGTAILSHMYYDTDYCEALEPEIMLIIYKAAQYLYTSLTNGASSNDIDRYRAQGEIYGAMYEQAKQRGVGSRRKPKKVWAGDSRRLRVYG